jgi:hypothetical protein
MTDPVYGDNPIDPEALWNEGIRPATWKIELEYQMGLVAQQAMAELLESLWLTRWRTSLATAEGIQLDTRASELGFLCPDGWSEARCQATLQAIFAAALVVQTPAVAYALATAMLDVGQSVTMFEELPCAARFVFLETSSDDAISYATALDRARPNGHQFYVVAHPGGGGSPFVIDSSTIDGPDTLGIMIGP